MPRVHIVQPDIRWHDKPANHEHVRQLLDDTDVQSGDLILLPEMFDTGFSFAIESTNDKRGQTLQFLLDLADDTGALVQGGRTFAACHKQACSARNLMSVVAPGQKLVCEYAKQRLFTPSGEHERFEPGRETVTYAWGQSDDQLTVQPAICYDLRFPELFRAGLKAGAQAIALGACWPSVRQHHWRSLLIARAIENQAFVFAANRVGNDPPKPDGSAGLNYAGGSIAISPKGEVLAEATKPEPCVLSVDVDASLVRTWRTQFPAWREA
jgi:predicted amidohydrolase